MSRSLGIPLKLLHEATGHIVSVELRSGELYRGRVIECEDNWNCQLENITYTAKDGKVSLLEHAIIRGSKVRFMVIPHMLKNAPMFKRLDARISGKGSALRVGRGRAVGMRARIDGSAMSNTAIDAIADCMKLGIVLLVKVYDNHPRGVATVQFKNQKDAAKCIKIMNGQRFVF